MIFLGTNGWYDTQVGNTICTLIEAKERYIVLDAGTGIYKLDKYIHDEKPIYLFLSHFHFDHIVGFHILNKFSFSQGLIICSYPGFKEIFRRIVSEPFTVPVKRLPYEVKFIELFPGSSHVLPWVECRELKHSSRCLGYRFSLEGKRIAYCVDTGPCDGLYELAKGVDLLITECSFKVGQDDLKWSHLDPEKAAMIAKEAGVRLLILTHFDAKNYSSFQLRKDAEDIAKSIFHETKIAFDDYKIEL